MPDSIIDSLIDRTPKNIKKPKIIKDLGISDPTPNFYNYINQTNNFDISKKIKIVVLNCNECKNWQDSVIKTSFDYYHQSSKNVELYFLNKEFKNETFFLLNKKNTQAANLFLLKKLLDTSFDDEDYILLLDNNFFFISNINKLIFERNICVSLPFSNINLENKWEAVANLVHYIKDSVSTYKNKINNNLKTNNNLNIRLYGLPIYMKKKLLKLIIDRWIEISCLLANFSNHQKVYEEIDWLMSLSFVLSEYNIDINNDNIIDISYINSFHIIKNQNYIFCNYKNKLFSIYNNKLIFDKKKYKPGTLIHYKPCSLEMPSITIFVESFNFVLTRQRYFLNPIIKNV